MDERRVGEVSVFTHERFTIKEYEGLRPAIILMLHAVST
jgi:hypothetical protein